MLISVCVLVFFAGLARLIYGLAARGLSDIEAGELMCRLASEGETLLQRERQSGPRAPLRDLAP